MKHTIDSVKELTGRYGSPLYVFDELGFLENAKKLESAMLALYPHYRIAYSFKTNYTPYICSTVKKHGAMAEVVSGFEYELAKRIGFAESEIIFNGPDKGLSGKDAFLNGCMIHVDSLDELDHLCLCAKDNPDRPFKIGLRINIDVGQSFISRFGMEEKDAVLAFQKVSDVPNLTIAGLHCHISRCRSKAAWKLRTGIMLRLADRLFDDVPEFIDLGSGMYGSMEPSFSAQFENVSSYTDYAEVTAGLMAQHYPGSKKPLLITEPGTTLVSRYVSCISRVDAIKRIRGKAFAVLDSGIHTLGETCTLKQLPICVIRNGSEGQYYESIDLTGYTCLEQDVVYRAYSGELAVGDYVIFGNVGGYSNVLKPPFIHPGCAMVAAKGNGTFTCIKRAENAQDMLNTYYFE